MSNSPLVNYIKISPNSTNPRKDNIKKITIHHAAGNLTIENIGNVFAPTSREASSNYGVGTDGRIGMYVEEKNRAWTSSNADNDNQAVTIEVANDEIGGNWHVSDKALEKTIELCVDICKRNGIEKLNFTGDKSGNLTMHKWFAPTICPGPYLGSKFPYIADEVNKRLNAGTEKPSKPSTGVLYRVQTGAFSNKSNADALLTKVKVAGFETYMVLSNGLYKVQVGAYGVKSNADAMAAKLKAKGFDVFITTESGSAVSSSPSPVNIIKVGSKVKVKSGAKSFTGGGLSSQVYKTTYDVIEVKGDRIVIGIGKSITAAMNKKDLILQ